MNKLETDYGKIIAEVLACDPIPACKREDGQLEPPWEVIARLRHEATTLRAALTRQRVSPVAAEQWRDDKEDMVNKISCLLGYVEFLVKQTPRLMVPHELPDVIVEANEWLETTRAAMQQPATGARTGEISP